MIRSCDLLIVGGGMVGLSVAALLSRNDKFKVTLVDAGPRPVFDPDQMSLRVSSIAPGSIELLDSAGAWEEIAATRACPFRDMKVWDAAGSVDGPETLSFESAEFAVPQLGFIVENSLVQQALLNQLSSLPASVQYGSAIRSIQRNDRRYEVELADGSVMMPDLLVGADGAGSFVRGCAGIDVETRQHDQKALVTILQPEYSHRHTAWQRFLQDGPIGILPLLDGRVSIVWSTTPARVDAALEMTDDELGALLTDITDGVLGKLVAAGPRGAFPLMSQHADRYAVDGLVLVGDAAHAIHPLAGQGVNLGFADARELAGVLSAAVERDENVGDLPTLRVFERARKGDNQAMLRFMDILNRLFSNTSVPLARLRGAGMYLFNRSGAIRERVVQTALGIR